MKLATTTDKEVSQYRFFFEVPFDASAKEPDFMKEWLERGDLKLFKDGEKVGIDGFEFGTECAFYELAEYIGGKDILAYQNPVGEVMDFQVGYDSGSNKFFLWQAMKYVVEFLDDYIPPVGALDQRPVGMNDEEWRMWVMINYNHNHMKFS